MPKGFRHIGNGYMALRWEIFERDKFTCQYCGQYAPNVPLEVDHVIPVEDGGTDDLFNLKTSCYACNRGKSGLRIRLRRSKNARTYVPSKFQVVFRTPVVLECLKSGPMTPPQLAKKLDIAINNAHKILFRLYHKGIITKKGRGVYCLS